VVYVAPIHIKKIAKKDQVVNIVNNNIVPNEGGKNGNMEYLIVLCKITQ
jgi:hypothetical protein|tara:strand:- start:596 stop:742 length:147 start_codon:yes stop_codon:yes gene_type:complete